MLINLLSLDCWDIEPDYRPTIFQVVDETNTNEVELKSTSEQIINGDIQSEKDSSELSKQEFNSSDVDASSNSLHRVFPEVVDEVELKSTGEQIINGDIPSEKEF